MAERPLPPPRKMCGNRNQGFNRMPRRAARAFVGKLVTLSVKWLKVGFRPARCQGRPKENKATGGAAESPSHSWRERGMPSTSCNRVIETKNARGSKSSLPLKGTSGLTPQLHEQDVPRSFIVCNRLHMNPGLFGTSAQCAC